MSDKSATQDANHPMQSAIEQLAQDLSASQNIVILTGAGISVASGIPPFRKSADAVWERDVTELGTRRFFQRSPLESWLWYLNRFERLLDKEPNPAHHAIHELEEWGRARNKDVTLVTQNVDLLHRKAGSEDLIEIHGRADQGRCSEEGSCEYASPRGTIPTSQLALDRLTQSKQATELPRCPQCDSIIRPHILWFDEYYTEHEDYQFERAMRSFAEADLFICSGTSFSVGITALALNEVERRGVKMWGVDPSPDHEVFDLISWVTEPSEQVFPLLMRQLSASPLSV